VDAIKDDNVLKFAVALGTIERPLTTTCKLSTADVSTLKSEANTYDLFKHRGEYISISIIGAVIVFNAVNILQYLLDNNFELLLDCEEWFTVSGLSLSQTPLYYALMLQNKVILELCCTYLRKIGITAGNTAKCCMKTLSRVKRDKKILYLLDNKLITTSLQIERNHGIVYSILAYLLCVDYSLLTSHKDNPQTNWFIQDNYESNSHSTCGASCDDYPLLACLLHKNAPFESSNKSSFDHYSPLYTFLKQKYRHSRRPYHPTHIVWQKHHITNEYRQVEFIYVTDSSVGEIHESVVKFAGNATDNSYIYTLTDMCNLSYILDYIQCTVGWVILDILGIDLIVAVLNVIKKCNGTVQLLEVGAGSGFNAALINSRVSTDFQITATDSFSIKEATDFPKMYYPVGHVPALDAINMYSNTHTANKTILFIARPRPDFLCVASEMFIKNGGCCIIIVGESFDFNASCPEFSELIKKKGWASYNSERVGVVNLPRMVDTLLVFYNPISSYADAIKEVISNFSK